MLHNDYDRRYSVEKISGQEPQEAWRQDELISGKPSVVQQLWLSEFDLDSWKGAAIQRGLEPGNIGIAIVGAVTRQLLVTTLRARKELPCSLL
jgi:hypothetical protein